MNQSPDTTNAAILICECGSTEHQIVVRKDGDDNDLLYFEIHLVHRGFWRRLVAGVKYIFGYRSWYGEWDDFLVEPATLRTMLDNITSTPA